MEESHEYGEEEFEDAGEEKEAETREAEAESYREEYEEEEETEALVVEAPSPLQTMRFEDDDEEPSTASTPIRANKAVKKKKKTVKSVLDQSSWTYTVKAKRIRELRIPAANVWSGGADAPVKTPRGATPLPVIRDLRIFSVLDKQPMQSHGSKWKSEPRQDPPKPPNALRRSSISSATSPGRRSGVVQETYWKNTDGELQWMFTMDRFRRLKAYSPRLKLFVYGIGVNAQADNVGALSEDSPRDHRESIVSLGWFFLDLRTPDLPERWFKLQNSPFGGEIMISTTFLPADMGHARQSHGSLSALVTRETNNSSGRPKIHVAVTRGGLPDDDEEYLRVGSRPPTGVFLVSIFIRGASNLAQIVRTRLRSAPGATQQAQSSGCWLSYSFFDLVIQTEVFHDLERAEFPPIRDIFRVLSCPEDLREFFEEQDTLNVFLCTASQVVSNVEIPLKPLLKQRLFTSDASEEAVIDGNFVFGHPSTGGTVAARFFVELIKQVDEKHVEEEGKAAVACPDRPEMDPTLRDLIPLVVHVQHVSLKAAAVAKFVEQEGVVVEVLVNEQTVRQPIRFHVMTKDSLLGDCASFVVDASPTGSISVSCASSVSDLLIASSSEQDVRQDGSEISFALRRDGQHIGDCILSTRPQPNKTEEALEEILVPDVTRKYRVFVQIKSLRNFESTNPVSISFVNPFSGKERIETPLLSLAKKAEVVVPDAHCIFDIYKDESSLRDTMEAPMILDVNETLSDGSRRLIGQAVFSVNYLYFSEETFCCADPNCGTVFKSDDDARVHWRNTHRDSEASSSVAQIHSYKSCSIYLPVMSSDTPVNSSAPTRIGAVRLIASLEDMGILSSEEAAITQEMRVPRHMGRAPRRVHFQGGSTRVVESFDDDQSRNAIRQAAEVSMDDAVQDGRGNANVVSEPVDDSATQREIQALKAQLLKERAAWQQEQASQQTQWKKRLSDLEKARMDELEEEWARREEERSTVVRAAQTEYQQLEQKLRATLAEVENRERNLAIAEAALERDQRMQREDHELLRKRLQSEQSHALQLAQRQIETLEKRLAELQSHLQIAEKRTQQIEEDFAEYRRQQRKVPETKLREEISSLKGHIVELERANLVETRAREQAEANVDKMREQLEKMAKLVQNEKKRNETRVLEELEKLRLKYVAREERYVLDGDREELRAIKKQLDELRQVNRVGRSRYDDTGSVRSVSRPHARVHIPQASPIHPRNHGDVLYEAEETYQDTPVTTELYDQDIIRTPTRKPRHPGPRLAARREMAVKENAQANDLPRDRELQRLQREKDLLLRTGTYDDNSFLVRELDRLIVLRQDQLARQQRIL